MEDKGLMEFKSFKGSLASGENQLPITFKVRLDAAGEAEFEFEVIPLTKESSFVNERWEGAGREFGYFTLTGTADDGTSFKTDNLHFNSANIAFDQVNGTHLRPVGSCSLAVLRRKLVKPAERPQMLVRLKGFKCFRQIRAECELGTVVMAGEAVLTDPDRITGYLAIEPKEQPADFEAWRAAADKLLEYVRRIMSFAASTYLRSPAREVFYGEEVETTVYSQTRQHRGETPVFHYLDLDPVFTAAVNSYFNPPFEIKNLFFAVEWFSMDAGYSEVKLVNAMTALENLIDSNLTDTEAFLLPSKAFEKIRRGLRAVIRTCIERWHPDLQESSLLADLNEKLEDLNRRSFRKKLLLLTARWSVPLDGISDDMIKAAISARNLVVHRGQYYATGTTQPRLWDHISLVREIVTRFLLASIGYQGRYMSYIEKCHFTQFPPERLEPADTTGH